MAFPSQKLNEGYYSILGLAQSASPSAIRSAYRKLAMIWHPDKCGTGDLAARAKLKFQEIQEAYTVLSDVRKKALYDNGLYDPNDNEEDVEGLNSLMNEILSAMNEIRAAEYKNGGGVNSFEEIQQLFVNAFNRDNKMERFGDLATDFGYPAAHFSHLPTQFRYPTTHFNYPTVHPKAASLNNKRDRELHEGSLPSDILGNGQVYDPIDMSHASSNTAKRKKRIVEQDGRPFASS